tara:strand:- start:205 stop:975 length:771 start_codon:yes stop_codon:yes gene_type:complete
MEYCKNCLSPIASDEENQIYCSFPCWQSYHNTKNISKEVSALVVWLSIIGSLLVLLSITLIIFSLFEDSEFSLPLLLIFSSMAVFYLIKEISDERTFKELFSVKDWNDALRLIGIILLLDLFVIAPINLAFTQLFFPNAEQQEVIGMLDDSSDSSKLLLAFSVSILTPIAEELLFRGFIMGMLLRRYSETTSIVLSSLIFAVLHEPIAMVLAFGGGLLYGWVRVKTGSIIPGIIGHAIWNGFVTILVIFVLAMVHI